MSVWVGEIEVTQNEDFGQTYGFATQDPTQNIALAVPFTFVGCTAQMQVRESAESTSTELLALSTSSGIVLGGPTVIANVNCGTISITITNGQTVGLPTGTWFYDLIVTNQNGAQTVYMQGPFTVNPTVTR
jgi:hypothetical protein